MDPDFEIRGGGGGAKNIFFGPPGTPPWIRNC